MSARYMSDEGGMAYEVMMDEPSSFIGFPICITQSMQEPTSVPGNSLGKFTGEFQEA
jgi:hypothetical protein